jgi:nitrite reductase/ring-hydroxylating ferredoxin subunit
VRLKRGIVLAQFDEVADGGAVVVFVGEGDARISLVLTRRGGAVACFHNRCAHANYPLQRADGRILIQDGRYLVCGAHGASYRLEDGACAGGPCNGAGLERISIVVCDGAVLTA